MHQPYHQMADTRRLGASDFRQAMRRVPTSVAVLSTVNGDGTPCGVTIGSLSSLSLDPTLLTWSLQVKARSHPIFCDAHYFAISVLSAEQGELAQIFGSPIEDRFERCSWFTGNCGIPILEGASAYFEGVIKARLPGGDHTIFVGAVETAHAKEVPPLIHCDGRFGRVAHI